MRYGMAVDIGKAREVNQDAAFTEVISTADGNVGLFAVIDGMGDNNSGTKAAEIVRNGLISALNVRVRDKDSAVSVHDLRTIVNDVNKSLLHTRNIRKVGAAVTVSIVFQNTIAIAYIGDCRAYLISRDCVEQITEDHVTYMKVIELGYSIEVIPEREPQRVLIRAIGMSPDIEPDMARMSLLQDAALVLCSDGIHQTLSDDEIARIVRQANPPQAACDALVAAANAQGGKDNMSVVVVEVEAATGKSG